MKKYIIILVLIIATVCLADIFQSHLKPGTDNALDIGIDGLYWRTFRGYTFTDGTANWTSNSLSGFTSISGTTLTDGVFTVSGGIISAGTWQGSTITVPYGGTGASTLTDGGLLVGSGTGAITALGVATNGQIPIGDGTTDPVLATITAVANETDVTNAAGAITIGIVNPLIVAKGGTGAETLTDGGILLGSGTSAITALGAATNGQIPIGDGTTDPVLATVTGTTNQINIANGAGSITLSTPQDINIISSPTFADVNVTDEDTGYQIDGASIMWTGTSTDYNIFLGEVAFTNDEGQYNVGIGFEAGKNNNTSGAAAYGDKNVYIGYQAGYGLASGDKNRGYENFGLGYTTLWANTTGFRNVAIGASALNRNTTGNNNIGLGRYACWSNTTGSGNISIGENAGRYNQSGIQNVKIGSRTGEGSSGNSHSENVFIGQRTAFSITTGSSNVFLGYRAGYDQTTNSNRLIIDNQRRGSDANELAESLIYGIFDNDANSQSVRINAALQMGDDKLIAFDTNAGLTASTTQTQGQGALTAQVNEISTVANKDDTVTLPSAITGVEIEIINNGAETLLIFPASADNLGLGPNTPEELEANERVKFVAYDTTNWAKESTTEIIHAEIHDEDNTDAFVINDAGADFHSYHTNGLAAGDLADWAFDAGGAGTSHAIASIADGVDSGNYIEVTTSDNHLLAVGDIVSQTNLADAAYVGVFDVNAIISVTQYEVAAAYTATGTGTMDQAATLEADAVAAGVYSFAYCISAKPVGNQETFDFQLYKEATAVIGSKIRRKFGAQNDFGSMSGCGVISVGSGEKISFALSNENSNANLTIRNLTIVLIRL